MHACVHLLRTGFEQIVKLFVAPDQLLNRKHGLSQSVLDRAHCCNVRTAFAQIDGIRNHLPGTIEKIVSDKVVPEVVMRTAAGLVTSIITTGSVERMNLKEGHNVFSVMKATSVWVEMG